MIKVVRAFASATVSGEKDLNEDSVIVLPEKMLFGIADGYGGQNIGDAASKAVLGNVKYFVEHGLGDSEVTLPFVFRSYYTDSSNMIFNAILFANQKLVEENKRHHINARGGASVLFGFFEGRHLTLANVGTCGAFLVRPGLSQPIVVPLLTPRSYQAKRGPQASEPHLVGWNFPLISCGHKTDVEPEIIELQVQKGDIIFLSSDGLFSWLQKEDLAGLEELSEVSEQEPLSDKIGHYLDSLLDTAKKRGAKENMSGILLLCA
ncbi:MAG: PP2C family serine/threonine-protein phosphatase [Bacteriovoracia bacterium]